MGDVGLISKQELALEAAAFERLCGRVRACEACAGMDRVHVLSAANGPLDAKFMFVAEAPGRLGAARTGVPLTSDRSGRRFEAFLAVAGIERECCFVTNAVLCNPLNARGNNRPPRAGEVAACGGFLREQLDAVRAPVVVALGRVALDALGRTERHGLSLSRDVGRAVAWRGRTLVALYHPGVRSTMARSQALQEEDWKNLTP
jgi:uracil-DNA glycosylase family 4